MADFLTGRYQLVQTSNTDGVSKFIAQSGTISSQAQLDAWFQSISPDAPLAQDHVWAYLAEGNPAWIEQPEEKSATVAPKLSSALVADAKSKAAVKPKSKELTEEQRRLIYERENWLKNREKAIEKEMLVAKALANLGL